MKVSKRELSVAARNLFMLLSSDGYKKSADKFFNKSKKPECVVAGNVYITPEFVISCIFSSDEPESHGFVLYFPDEDKQLDEVAWVVKEENIENNSLSILTQLFERNGIKVRKLY